MNILNINLNIIFKRLKIATKWIVFSILSGILIGGVGISFYYCMDFVTTKRIEHPWLIFFLLPIGGVIIVFL